MNEGKTPVKDILVVAIGSLLIFSLLFAFRNRGTTGTKAVSCVHSYSAATGDKCIICGAEYEPVMEEVDKIMYTAKNNVVVRSDYYTADNVVDKLPINTPVMVSEYFLSSIGSEWYLLEDGNYIFAPNLMDEPYVCTVHSYGTGEKRDICTVCGRHFVPEPEEYHRVMYAVSDGVTVRSEFYSDKNNVIAKLSQNDQVNVVAMVDNSAGNTWYQLESGGYVFEENLSAEKVPCTDHVFEGNTCIKCGYEYIPVVTPLDMVAYSVKDGTVVRNGYYNGEAVIRTLAFNEAVTVKGVLTNALGSVWYLLDDGLYVYSKNVSASKTPCADHPFSNESGNICPVCGFEYQPTVTEMDVIMYSVRSGVPVRESYYSSTQLVRNLEENEAVRVTGLVMNSLDKEWYRLSGGYYVYKENLVSEPLY